MNGLKLINPQKDFEFAGTTYKVRNATLEKIILFQARFQKLTDEKDAAIQSKIAMYCIYLILKDATPVIPDITEDWVAQNCPDVEMADVLEEFAFMNRQKVEVLRSLLQRNAPDQTGKPSSQ
jgi:hypothetical protein